MSFVDRREASKSGGTAKKNNTLILTIVTPTRPLKFANNYILIMTADF